MCKKDFLTTCDTMFCALFLGTLYLSHVTTYNGQMISTTFNTQFKWTLIFLFFYKTKLGLLILREAHIPLREALVALRDKLMPLRETLVPLREALLPLREALVPLREAIVPLGWHLCLLGRQLCLLGCTCAS